MKIEELKKISKIAILGYGKEGESTLNFLLKIGIEKQSITILDKNIILPFYIDGKGLGIGGISGENYLDNLDNFDLIFKTPGISPYNEKISKYRDKLISQAEIFFDNYIGKVIGVTATKGKSTTVTIIYETLKNAGYKVKLVGNIGNPVLDEVDLISGDIFDFIIYELSSYMLEMFIPKCFIAILGNIYIDHLDWHGNDFENYKRAKLNILEKSENILIRYEFRDLFNNKKDNTKTFGLNGDYTYKNGKFYIGDKIFFDDKEILLKGEHNMINICSVLGIMDIVETNFSASTILQPPPQMRGNEGGVFSSLKYILKTFSGLPHRLENIGTYHGVTFIDDANATTPEGTIEAIKTFGFDIGTIFLGGNNRGYNFKSLVEYLAKYSIKNIVLFPETGKNILEEIKNLNLDNINFLETSLMKEAVEFGFKYSGKGKVCLLSMASPSYFLWKSFGEKGDEFKKEVQAYNQ